MGRREGLVGGGTSHSKVQGHVTGCDLETSLPQHEMWSIGSEAREIARPCKINYLIYCFILKVMGNQLRI